MMSDTARRLPEAPAINPAEPYLTHAQEIKALKQFCAKVQRMSPNGRRAAIFWLADYFLGIKLWHW